MEKEFRYDVVVIGAGPAGLLAAGRAAMEGVSVLLLEKMEKPARKLRITGKGRCNITNIKPFDEFLAEINPEPRFLRDAFNEFFSNDLVELLRVNGVETIIERGQRVFPASGKAWDVAEALVRWAKKCGVRIENNHKVDQLILKEGKIAGVKVIHGYEKETVSLICKTLIIATGGKSYPATGSTGDGYNFATKCGHAVVQPRPSLVGVETTPVFGKANGLTLKNVNLSLLINGKKQSEEFGELELTEYGLSGPIVLKHSRKIVEEIDRNQHVELLLDIKPALNHEKLDARLLREIQESPRISVNDLGRRLLPREMVNTMIDSVGLAAQKPLSRLTAEDRKSIRIWLKELRFMVTGYRSWEEAIVTAGGVSLKEVDPKTMSSKLVEGLYFAGEVLDLDGSTGGFNLQIAFSTGWLAGKSAASKV